MRRLQEAKLILKTIAVSREVRERHAAAESGHYLEASAARRTHLKKAPLNLEDVTLYSTGLMAELTYTRMRKAYSRLKYTSWMEQKEGS